jgi:hypothetical protein
MFSDGELHLYIFLDQLNLFNCSKSLIMDFLTFLISLPIQQDKGSQDFIAFALSDKQFPITSDPEKLAHYLYRRLNHRLTLSYQKLLMLYFFTLNHYKQPDDPTLLDKINLIVFLQNNDPLYRNIEN